MQYESRRVPGAPSRVIKLALAVFALPALNACSLIPEVPGMDRIVGEEGVFRDRKEEYLEAQTIPRTEIPQGLDSYIIDDLLVIPELPQTNAVAYPDPPRPMPLAGRSEREVVIQRMQDRSWIIADVSPSQIWPRLRDYWRQKGVPIEVENPSEGLMDTGWFVLDDNVLTRERFRVTIETGFQNNSSEIRLLHMSAPQALPVMEQANWPQSSSDQTLAYDFLVEMFQYLADVADLYQASSASFLARTLSNTGKANLTTTPAGNSLLQLQADYDRSWAALRRALLRSNVEILSEDVELGVIELNFDPEAIDVDGEEVEEPGFFRKLITLNGAFSDDDERSSHQIRLQVLATGDTVEVLALPAADGSDQSAAPEAIEAANALLELLRNTIA